MTVLARRVEYTDGGFSIWTWCPGCDQLHPFAVEDPSTRINRGVTWHWDGDLESPTFSPSLLVHTGVHLCAGKHGLAPCPDPEGCGALGHALMDDGTRAHGTPHTLVPSSWALGVPQRLRSPPRRANRRHGAAPARLGWHRHRGDPVTHPDLTPSQNAILTKGTEPAPAVIVGDLGVPVAHATTSSVSTGDTVLVAVEPTQVRRPWRATVRTGVQALLAFATLVPLLVTGIYEDGDYPAIVAQVVAVSAAVSRVMALPQVEAFLRRFVPWLAAAK